MRSISRVSMAILVMTTMLLVAAPVATATEWTTSSQSGSRAFAANETCTDNPDGTITCSGETIDVFSGTTRSTGQPTQKGQQVCYGQFSHTFDPLTGEGWSGHGSFGCTSGLRTATFDQLDVVTLAPTVIDLIAYECDSVECTESSGGSATISGTWSGSGPVVSQKGKFKFDDGSCLQVHADKSRFRNATFVGSIDGAYASIGEGTYTFRTTCSF